MTQEEIIRYLATASCDLFAAAEAAEAATSTDEARAIAGRVFAMLDLDLFGAPPHVLAVGRRFEDIERDVYRAVLADTGWNVRKAAAILDMPRSSFYGRLIHLGIELPPRYTRQPPLPPATGRGDP